MPEPVPGLAEPVGGGRAVVTVAHSVEVPEFDALSGEGGSVGALQQAVAPVLDSPIEILDGRAVGAVQLSVSVVVHHLVGVDAADDRDVGCLEVARFATAPFSELAVTAPVLLDCRLLGVVHHASPGVGVTRRVRPGATWQ